MEQSVQNTSRPHAVQPCLQKSSEGHQASTLKARIYLNIVTVKWIYLHFVQKGLKTWQHYTSSCRSGLQSASLLSETEGISTALNHTLRMESH